MSEFRYTAKDKQGHTIKGEVKASDKKHALDILRAKELLIIKLVEAREAKSIFSFISRYARAKIKMDELVVFARQMATMTEAGITIVSSLDTLAEQTDNPFFRKVLLDVRGEVNTGLSLSDAMAKYTSIFSPYFVNMVRAGESSGMLDEVLNRIAAYLEKTNTLQKKVKSAMIYPAVVTFMAFVITLVMILNVIPVFKDMYAGFGASLPRPTQFLINLSDFLRNYFWVAGLFFGASMAILKWYAGTEKGRFMLDSLKLRLPVFGNLIKKVSISKFTRTLSTLIKSGVPILSSLEIVAKTAGNAVIEKAIYEIKTSVKEGETIAEPMAKSGIFPPVVIRMVAVGEKSGELEKMLVKIADFFDEMVNTAVDGLTSLIEPLIIVFLGVVIGGIVICMFLPVFKISSLIQM